MPDNEYMSQVFDDDDDSDDDDESDNDDESDDDMGRQDEDMPKMLQPRKRKA